MNHRKILYLLIFLACCSVGISYPQTNNMNGSWAQLISGTTNDLRSVHFINSNKGWTVGLNGTILFTSNAGDSWTAQNPGTNSTQSYADVRFIDENIGWAGGGKVVSRTTNGGANWGGLEYLSSNPWRSSLFPVSATVAWGTGWSVSTFKFREFYRYTVQPDGSMLQEFWSQVSSDYLHGCFFIDSNNGWAVGNPGRIVRIANASSSSPTFTNQASGTSETLVSVQMLDANIGWVVGDNGTILKTIDGGNTWSPQTSGTTVFLRGVHFVNVNQGWIVGNDGTILSTVNGGANWTVESSGITTDLFEVCFITSDLGYIVGDSGVILKYEGGGVINQPPVLSPIADQTLSAGITKNIPISASDADGDQIAFNIPTNPGFLSITNVSQIGNNALATLVIAPGINQAGVFHATVKVDDGKGGSDSKSFNITVTSTTDLPPAAPQNLTAIAHSNEVTLSWDANTEADFLRYRIYGDINPNPTTPIDSTDGISNTIKSIEYLMNNTTYYFRITAVDNVLQESGFSNELAAIPGPALKLEQAGDLGVGGTWALAPAWGDYDNDGDLDLFVAAGDPAHNNLLYRNNGDGTFTKITEGIIVNDDGDSRGCSWGDYNNDGHLDLFVANDQGGNNCLYKNNGNGSFAKIVISAVVIDGGNSISCSWGDYNNDGFLDLFVANFDNQRNFLYKNNGNGTFTKIITGEIVNDQDGSRCGSWADYDNDGDLDLFVANSPQNNCLYKNNGDGTFTKITSGEIVNDGGHSNSASWGDYDNDNDLDLFVVNGQHEPKFLYQNNGDGTFTKIDTGIIVTDLAESNCSSWGDYDNDGDLDLIVTSGNQTVFLYANDGMGNFTKITTGEIINNHGDCGTAWGDFDNDGDLDLFSASSGNNSDYFYVSSGNSNHWINIKCIGTVSNTCAIGTKVRVKANIGRMNTWQVNELSGQTGASFGSQNSLNAEFGLGDATVIDSIKVEWPSGIVQVLTNIAADQFLTITEAATPQITVISPDGGENWLVDTPQQIKWTSYAISGNVKIEISTNVGSTWSVIAGDAPNSGSYFWTPTASFVSNNCLIKITSVADNAIFDQSNSVFSIAMTAQVNLWIDDNLTGPSGGIINIPINCSDFTGLEVYAVNFIIAYDTSVLKATDLDISGTVLAASGWSKPPFNISNGKISSAMAATSPLSGSGILIKVVYNIVGSSGDSSLLHFDKAILNEGNPTVSTDDGLFRVASNFDIKGKLAYFYNQTAIIDDALVLLSGASSKSDTSDATGSYEFLDLISGNYNVTPQKGNDTKDAISAYDASLILRFNIGTVSLTPYQMIAADVSGNGDVLAFDASYILRYSIGLVTQFPVGADWTFVPHDFPIDVTNWFTSPRNRIYAPLQSDQSDQNFIGILYGDVSGNWGGSMATDSLPMIALAISNIQQTNDGKWLIVLELKFPQIAYSGSLKLLVKNSDLNFESCWLDSPAPTDMLLAANSSTREIKIAYASSQSLNITGIKMKLLFNPQNPVNPSGSDFEFTEVVVDEKSAIITSVETHERKELPTEWSLSQNYPNPFNPETRISYHVPKSSHVVIEVFNLLGQRLQKLVDGLKDVGIYQVVWNGRDESGNPVVSGIYICKMQADGFISMKKMVLAK